MTWPMRASRWNQKCWGSQLSQNLQSACFTIFANIWFIIGGRRQYRGSQRWQTWGIQLLTGPSFNSKSKSDLIFMGTGHIASRRNMFIFFGIEDTLQLFHLINNAHNMSQPPCVSNYNSYRGAPTRLIENERWVRLEYSHRYAEQSHNVQVYIILVNLLIAYHF